MLMPKPHPPTPLSLPARRRLALLGVVVAAVAALVVGAQGVPALVRPDSSAVMNAATSAFERGDYGLARRWFRVLAVRAEPAAETMLGVMAAEGLGRPQSDAFAAAWMLRAARRGYAPAELALAHSFANGLGVPADPARALALAQSAAIQNLPGARQYAAHLQRTQPAARR